jgi:hypothetical protein
MLRRMALVRTDVSEERIASIIKLLVTANVVPSSPILVTSVTRRNIPEDGILHSQRRDNPKSYLGNSVVVNPDVE